MHSESLRFLYREYRNCLKNEFSDYFGKDDYYKSYLDKCHNQKEDIRKYYEYHFGKVAKIHPSRENNEVEASYEEKFKHFSQFGWSERQIRNYILNYDRSNEEYDVWANQVTSRDTEEKWGMLKTEETLEEDLPTLLNKATLPKRKTIWESFKWTGKADEKWNFYRYYGCSYSIPGVNA